jgi:hypothetical protein
VRGGALGLGLLLGGATFAYAYSCGCRKAEILAINDDGEAPAAGVFQCVHMHRCSASCCSMPSLVWLCHEVTAVLLACMWEPRVASIYTLPGLWGGQCLPSGFVCFAKPI